MIKNNVSTQIIPYIMSVFLLFTLIGINTVQAWEACPPIVEIQSTNSNIPTSITFTVDSSAPFPLDIMWIDQFGKMKKYNRLVPGQSYTQQTYVGHVWSAYDGTNCEYFEATRFPSRAHIKVNDYQNYTNNSIKTNNSPNQTPIQVEGHAFTVEEEYLGTNVYGYVRGWRVVQGNFGCSTYKPGSGPSLIFNTPPAGNWQIIYRYPNKADEIKGMIDVDKKSFPQTFYVDNNSWAYGNFSLDLRLAIKAGHYINTRIGSVQYEESLSGATAALLKTQECWQQLSGWSTASNKAGTFAFSGY